MIIKRSPLSPSIYQEIYRRQLIADRDAIARMHTAAIRANGCPYGGVTAAEFPAALAAIELIARQWVIYGWPRPGWSEDLDLYLIETFPGRLSEQQRNDICEALQSAEHIDETLFEGGEIALEAAGGSTREVHCLEAIKAALSAKARSAQWFREWLERGELPFFPPEIEVKSEELNCGSSRHIVSSHSYIHLLDIHHNDWNRLACLENAIHFTEGTGSGTDGSSREAELPNTELIDNFVIEVKKCGDHPAGNKRAHWCPKTETQFRSTMMLLIKHIKGSSLLNVKPDDLFELDKVFGRLPIHHHKSHHHKERSLEEICQEAAEGYGKGELTADQIGLSVVTTNRHFRFLKEFFDWLNKPMSDQVKWQYLTDRDVRDRRDRRLAFTVDQATQLFSLPIWTGCASEADFLMPGNNIYHGSGYWVLLLLWYGGFRRGEICKVLLEEVVRTDGIWIIGVQENDLGGVKNASARRKVPLHPELLRLGFLDYVDALRERGERRLFPELAADKTAPDGIWFNRYWPKIAKALPFVGSGMSPHSMRHAVETELKHAGVSPEFRNDLLGHSNPSDGGGRYGKATRVALLLDVVQKMPIVTAHLKAYPINLVQHHTRCRDICEEPSPPGKVYPPRPRLVLT